MIPTLFCSVRRAGLDRNAIERDSILDRDTQVAIVGVASLTGPGR